MNPLFTVGHSRHDIDAFIALLEGRRVQAVADVRSHPYSRRMPHYCREALQESLAAAGIAYVYLGDTLGARPHDPALYSAGRADFARMRATPGFDTGLRRLVTGLENLRVAAMCAEAEPADCHRTWLIAQTFHDRGHPVEHLRADGSLESHLDLLWRCAGGRAAGGGLFDDDEAILKAVVQRESHRVAHVAGDHSEENE